MIPNYQQFMRPLLEIANANKGQEIKISNAIDILAEQFGLTEEDKAKKLPSGKQTVLANRIGWAKTYLSKAGLLDTTKRAHFTITHRGKEALSQNIEVNNQYLKQFAEFQEFKQKNTDSSAEQSTPQPLESSEETSTPDEILRNAYTKIHDELAEEILERTRKVTPAFFESLLIELLLAMGYGGTGEGAAHALGQSGDNGVDGVIDQDPLGVDQVYIQAKRYAEGNNVSAGDIRDFFGALNLKRAQKGIFITTSEFTASAKETTQNLGMRIVLINGTELAKLMLRYNIGSRDEDVLTIKKIDEEFFEN